MKIAIISDIHDSWGNLQEALNIISDQKCDRLFVAGDLISPPGLRIIKEAQIQTELILGNNEGALVVFTRLADSIDSINFHEYTFEEEVSGKQIFMHHLPRPVELAAKSGEFDVCIHGHTHFFRNESFDDALLLNPGSLIGNKEPAGFVILDLDSLEVERLDLAKQ
ncbi:YfcE family phosphodiesterase [Candidatus Dojkabacteria bacterium]|nr:YfcE family phosphodiesterase [Candidatus Dojkabacteria bacterium]